MKRIAIDMDEVMADALSALIGAYNMQYGESLSQADLGGLEIWEAIPAERASSIPDYLRSDGFFRNLEVIEGSQEVILKLTKTYEVFIATAAMEWPNSFTDKYDWLHEHFPFIPDSRIVFCGDKTIIHADYLIDDRSRQFERFTGQGILYTAPHNASETRYPRVDNWDDVARMFLSQLQH